MVNICVSLGFEHARRSEMSSRTTYRAPFGGAPAFTQRCGEPASYNGWRLWDRVIRSTCRGARRAHVDAADESGIAVLGVLVVWFILVVWCRVFLLSCTTLLAYNYIAYTRSEKYGYLLRPPLNPA